MENKKKKWGEIREGTRGEPFLSGEGEVGRLQAAALNISGGYSGAASRMNRGVYFLNEVWSRARSVAEGH